MTYQYQITSLAQYHQAYEKSISSPELFWAEIAEHFVWKKKWDNVLNWNFVEPKVTWFEGATLNITENCIDRHLLTKANETAIIWEPNNPNEKEQIITYAELHKQVCAAAQMLINLGVKKGDRVCIYMGMIPQLTYAVLACARVGAIHSVIFGGFSAQSVADRLHDAGAEFIITCDGAFRGDKTIPLKPIIDEAIVGNNLIKKVIVVERTQQPINFNSIVDVWWHEEMKQALEQVSHNGVVRFNAETMDAEDMLFILYTSGSTGKPKGVVHTQAGYMVWANYTFVNVFQYKLGQVYFCTADIGWITGHTYMVYGPLSAGATTLMFEGIPTWPDASRFWQIVDKHKAAILYTAPTAIRSLMAFGTSPLQHAQLNSLQVLGSVGEPINEEAWHWYDAQIGKNNCPIVDTWWQTETGGIMISNLAGVTPQKPAHATLPLPGIIPVLVDEQGNEIEGNNVSGNLCIKQPWPGMIRTTYGNHERCRAAYFDTYKNLYFTGDGCLRDEHGNYRITGRVDDVLNISGHRIGTAEVENAINSHKGVVESAVVGFPHDIKGQAIYAFVIFENHVENEDELKQQILKSVTKSIGAIAKPDKIQLVSGLPKTRSGKIMRRILRKIAEGDIQNMGDISTLLDPAVVNQIVKAAIL